LEIHFHPKKGDRHVLDAHNSCDSGSRICKAWGFVSMGFNFIFGIEANFRAAYRVGWISCLEALEDLSPNGATRESSSLKLISNT